MLILSRNEFDALLRWEDDGGRTVDLEDCQIVTEEGAPHPSNGASKYEKPMRIEVVEAGQMPGEVGGSDWNPDSVAKNNAGG